MSVPTPLQLDDETLRLYLQFRDPWGVGRIGYIDVFTKQPTKVKGVARQPVLDVGLPGAFDSNGVAASCVIRRPDGDFWLYYFGFRRRLDVRYQLLTGLAWSKDPDGPFQRVSQQPVLQPLPGESLFRSGAWVLPPTNGVDWRMWYVAGDNFLEVSHRSVPTYGIRMAKSTDGVLWHRAEELSLDFVPDEEHGLGRPFVLEGKSGLEMSFSVRKLRPLRYSLGFAVQEDSASWVRRDARVAEIDKQVTGTDGACEYLALIRLADHDLGFVNGFDFGATGLFVFRRDSCTR